MFSKWLLPHTFNFLKRISNSFCDGNSVLIKIPHWYNVGIYYGLKEVIWTNRERIISPINGNLDGISPIKFLYKHFLGESYIPKDSSDLETLLELQCFKLKICILEISDYASANDWCSFLINYSEHIKDYDRECRTVFLLLFSSDAFVIELSRNINIDIYEYNNIVDDFDMSIYANNLLQNTHYDVQLKEIFISMSASLALWDFDYCDVLLEKPDKNLFQPEVINNSYIIKRKWQSYSNMTISERKSFGCEMVYKDKTEVHSSLLNTNSKLVHLINNRIWEGQIGVLTKIIEKKRLKILDSYGEQFLIPIKAPYKGWITRSIDLEIGNMGNQVEASKVVLPEKVNELILLLREMRNNLSHLKPVSCEMLSREVFVKDFL